MKSLPLRVIKLGGSQLEAGGSIERLLNCLKRLPPARTLMLVGGGPPVDAIRQMAQLFAYDQEFLHWLCIDAMELSHRLVTEQLSQISSDEDKWTNVQNELQLRKWLTDPTTPMAVVHIVAFYTLENHRQLPIDLPTDWRTTSDALAALLAHLVAADELLLIKSCEVPEPYDWESLAKRGVVDQAFPQAIQGLPRVRALSI